MERTKAAAAGVNDPLLMTNTVHAEKVTNPATTSSRTPTHLILTSNSRTIIEATSPKPVQLLDDV